MKLAEVSSSEVLPNVLLLPLIGAGVFALGFGVLFIAAWHFRRTTSPVGRRALSAGVVKSLIAFAVLTIGLYSWVGHQIDALQEAPTAREEHCAGGSDA